MRNQHKTNSVRHAQLDDAPTVANALAAAFSDDPVGRWLAPDAATRSDRLTRFFGLYFRAFVAPHNEARTIEPVGAALWLPPGRWQIPPLVLTRTLPQLAAIFGRRTVLLLRGLSRVEHDHPRELHWYLPFIGVAPEAQGAGSGSALLAAVLDRCDIDQTPAYLEATNERNIALYQRHGFAIRGELTLPDGPQVWPMWRDPRPTS